jgi:phosphate-selective porin OprO/OprP
MSDKRFERSVLSALLASAFGAAALLPGVAQASEAELLKKIEALQAQIDALKAEVAMQRGAPAAKAAAAPAAPAQAMTAAVAPSASPVRSKYEDGYIVWSSADGEYELKLDGRVQLDTGSVDSDKNGAVVKSDTKFRRVRLATKTKLGPDWEAEFDLDFANNAVDTKDMWVAYKGIPNVGIKFGHFKPHFSLDQVTSSRVATYMESSIATDLFAPSRRIGLAGDYANDWVFVGAGVFGDKANTEGVARDNPSLNGVNETYGYSMRAVARPFWRGESDKVFHVGLNVLNNRPRSNASPDNARLKFASVLEQELSQVEFIDTKQIQGVDSALTTGLELAYKYGPHMLSAEYLHTKVKLGGVTADMDAGLAAQWPSIKGPKFDAYYVAYSYFLRGDRKYDPTAAEFSGVVGKNAIELTARYSLADMNDPDGGYTRNRTSSYKASSRGVFGGKAKIATLGVNWYPHSNVKFVLNYMLIKLDNYADADAGSFAYANGTVVPILGGDKIKVLGLKAQYMF